MKRLQIQFYIYSLILLFGFLQYQSVLAQFEIPPVPEFQTSVYDYVGLLTPSEKSQLENKLIKYSDTTSTQIVIAIIATTGGENITYLGAQWGEKWGIGQAKEDNGVLILLARDDRKIAINTAKGVEHLLTDALSKRIIENDILPEFRKDDYYSGLNKGADAIFAVMQGEYQGTRVEDQPDYGGPAPFLMLFIIIIIIFFIIRNRKGGRGRNRTVGGSIMDAIILSNLGRGGFGGGSSGGGFGGGSFGGGGGFGGGFGGGSFGGGGASGGW